VSVSGGGCEKGEKAVDEVVVALLKVIGARADDGTMTYESVAGKFGAGGCSSRGKIANRTVWSQRHRISHVGPRSTISTEKEREREREK